MMLQYILQTIVFQLIFLLVYELFLKKETFFNYNRAYLLLTPVLSFLLPLIRIPVLQEAVPAEAFVMLPEVFLTAGKAAATSESPASAAPETLELSWWFLVYGAGFLFSLGIFFQKFKVLKELFSNSTVLKNGKLKIVEVPKSKIACTFYETIFLGSELTEKEREQILSHELVHVRQRHTLDLLLFEFLKIVFWFNPLIYIYQAKITLLHEYLADAGGVKNVEKQDYFQQLLNSAFNTEDISFINQFFNHSIIKKRIVMLQKSRSRSISKFKFLIILPLMMAMLTYVSCSQEPEGQDELELDAQVSEEVFFLKVNDVQKPSSAEKEKFKAAVDEMKNFRKYEKVVLADDKKSFSVTLDPQTGKERVQVQKLSSEGEVVDVPFSAIDQAPVYPGCENISDNEERKDCLVSKMNKFINLNFDSGLGKELQLSGIHRIYVLFKINEQGDVEFMKARAPHPALEAEAERIVNLLPQMKPGEKDGEKVSVLYSLPITFKVDE